MIRFRDQVEPSDAAAVRAMVEATGMFRPNEVDVAVELVDEHLNKGEASGYHFIFALEDTKPIGYVCYGHISVTLLSYDLYWIVVDPQHQGRGIGRQLLSAAEKRIAEQGGQQIYIETSGREDYGSTRGFYLRCGYSQEAVIRDFYAPGDDKVVYVRRIV